MRILSPRGVVAAPRPVVECASLSAVLVGRDDDRATARAALEASGLVVLAGPPGIGKSSLAGELAPAPAARTGALSTLRWVPLLAMRRLVGDRVVASAVGPDPIAAEVLRGGAASLVVDDAQWADAATLDVLARLRGRLPMVVTVRTNEYGADEVLGLLELLGAGRVDLRPLAGPDAAALLDRLHPELDEPERDAVLEAAAGNPLLLAELPRGPAGAATLVAALVDRVDALDPAGVVAAHRLAVLGRPATLAELGPGAARLVAAGLACVEGPHVASVHGLLDEVIVEQLGPGADEVRRDLAGRVEPAEAAFLLDAAGDPAARSVALAAAAETEDLRLRAELLALAVRLADDVDVDRRVEAARLLTRVSRPDRAAALCEVDGLDDLPPLDRGRIHGAAAEAAWLRGDHETSRTRTELALADLAGSGLPIEVEVLAGSTAHHTFVDLDGRPVIERAREAVALADRLGRHRAYARVRLAAVMVTAGLPGAADVHREAMAMARAEGDQQTHHQAFTGLVLGTWVAGDVRSAAELARHEAGADGPDEGDLDLPALGFRAYVAILGLLAGDPPSTVVERFRPILQREPLFRGRAFMAAAVALALADLGRSGEAAALLGPDPVPPAEDAQQRSVLGWAAVEVAWAAGRLGDALGAAEAVVALGVGDYPSAVMARVVAGHAARELGRGPQGPAPLALLPAWQAAPIEWAALEVAHRGEARAAAEGFLEAAARWEGSDRRAELRCRWAAGDLLLGDDLERGREVLEAVEREAQALGALALTDRVRRSLRSAGIASRAQRAAGAVGLTAREEQVLDLVGAGRTTAQIAASLQLAPSTVDSFVRSAVRKLGASTRVAAAAELERRRAEDRR